MNGSDKALNKVLEATQTLISLDGGEHGAVPRREVVRGHEFRIDRTDRIAFPDILSTETARLSNAILGSALIAALSFASGWFARLHVYPPASNAPISTTEMQGGYFSSDSDNGRHTVSRDLPLEGRALLDAIAGSESAYSGRDPYKVIYGGRVAKTLIDHPRQYVQIATGPHAGQKTSAAGRYQYLEGSWDEARKALGLPDFSPASQDKAAFWDAQRAYRAKTGHDLVTDIREANADPQKLSSIGHRISNLWTSLPGGTEPNEATSSFGHRFAKHLRYYNKLARATTLGNRMDYTGAIRRGRSSAATNQAWTPFPRRKPRQRNVIFDQKEKGTAEVRDGVLPPAAITMVSGGLQRREHTGGITLPPETEPTTIDGWIVRDVIGGTAILESPNGVRKVALGDVLPELGKVDSILRWGKRWIVSTDRGLISSTLSAMP